MDLVFVVDSSRSLQPSEFQLVKQFIAEVVQGLVVSLDDVRVALVRFSTQVHVIAYLDQSTSSADVYETIKNMEYKPGLICHHSLSESVSKSLSLCNKVLSSPFFSSLLLSLIHI